MDPLENSARQVLKGTLVPLKVPESANDSHGLFKMAMWTAATGLSPDLPGRNRTDLAGLSRLEARDLRDHAAQLAGIR